MLKNMMDQFEIEVLWQAPSSTRLENMVREAATAVLLNEAVEPPAGLTIVFSNDETIKELNHKFLDLDKPTDVLSFPAGEKMPGFDSYLGDIIVSLPAARRQSSAAGHALEDEVRLLVVHGILHLLGHDHGDQDAKEVMWTVQKNILVQIGAEAALQAVFD